MTDGRALAPSYDPVQAVDLAWRRVCLALDRGLAAEALRWGKVWRALSAFAASSEADPVQAPSSSKWEKGESVFTDSHSIGPQPAAKPPVDVWSAPGPSLPQGP